MSSDWASHTRMRQVKVCILTDWILLATVPLCKIVMRARGLAASTVERAEYGQRSKLEMHVTAFRLLISLPHVFKHRYMCPGDCRLLSLISCGGPFGLMRIIVQHAILRNRLENYCEQLGIPPWMRRRRPRPHASELKMV